VLNQTLAIVFFFLYQLTISVALPLFDGLDSQIAKNFKWSKKKLSVDDFTGRIDSSSSHDATSSIATEFLVHQPQDGQVEAIVFCEFLPAESWFRNRADLLLLNHEQLHFDIAELVCRKTKFAAARLAIAGASIDSVELVAKGVLAKLDSIQNAYDSATNHGQNSKNQSLWNSKIRHELTQLAKFAQDTIRVTPPKINGKKLQSVQIRPPYGKSKGAQTR
jgi:hypothetical protein